MVPLRKVSGNDPLLGAVAGNGELSEAAESQKEAVE